MLLEFIDIEHQMSKMEFIFAKFHQKLLKILFFQNCNKVLPFGLDVDVLTTLNQEENHETELQVYDKYDATLHGLVHNKKKFV